MKGEKKYQPVSLFWTAVLIVALLVLWVSNAEAQHECQGGHNCNPDGVPVDVSQTVTGPIIGGDNSFGLGIGGSNFDFDIAQCLASKGTHIIVVSWSSLVENPVCIAQYLNTIGAYNAAARVLCKTDKLSDVYSSENECISAVEIPVPNGNGKMAEEAALHAVFILAQAKDEHEEMFIAQQQEIAYVKEELANLKAEPRVVYRKAKEPFLSDAKRAALLAVKEQ